MTTLAMRWLYKDTKGQDLVEYALMAGLVAALSAILLPDVATGLEAVFHKVSTVLGIAAQSRDYYGVY